MRSKPANQRGQAEVRAEGEETYGHHDPCHTFLLFSLPPSLSFSLVLVFFFSVVVVAAAVCITDPSSSVKQTSVGSLSNSTALLHQNRPPAVIADILPAATLRGEEVQSGRVARILSDTSGPPTMKETGAKGAFPLSCGSQCAKLAIISRRR